jgi:hypothetical protein
MVIMHCKDTIPKIRNKFSQKKKCAASVPMFTFMCLWAICIFPWSVCLFCCRKICRLILGIYKSFTDTWMWKLGLRPRNSQKRNTSLQCEYIRGLFPDCREGNRVVAGWPLCDLPPLPRVETLAAKLAAALPTHITVGRLAAAQAAGVKALPTCTLIRLFDFWGGRD